MIVMMMVDVTAEGHTHSRIWPDDDGIAAMPVVVMMVMVAIVVSLSGCAQRQSADSGNTDDQCAK